MIGVFDSGSGGLSFLTALHKRHPDWSYIYKGDYDHCPYWGRADEDIYELTRQWVTSLFDAGAEVVILACNTASAVALRRLQTELFPHKCILWVTIPWVEKIIELKSQSTLIFATQKTVESWIYTQRIKLLDPSVTVREIALPPELVMEIESFLPVQRCHSQDDFSVLSSLYGDTSWLCTDRNFSSLVEKYFSPLILTVNEFQDRESFDSVVLGCTHYSYLTYALQQFFPGTVFIDPSWEAVLKLEDYFSRKQQLFHRIGKTWEIFFI